MVATTRFVLFDPASTTSMTAATSDSISGTGTFGYVQSASGAPDTVTIATGSEDQFQVSIDGNSYQTITLTSGVDLDSRVVARDIEYKLKQLSGAPEMDHILCEYVNNKFRISSSTLGANSSAIVTNGGSRDVLHLLGMAVSKNGPLSITTVSGQTTNNNASYTGQVTVGGEYKGQFSDIYTIMIGKSHPVVGALVSGSYPGVATLGGDWNEGTDETYTVTISTAGGTHPSMNAGTGNVPTFTVTSNQGDNIATPTELLYSDYWYEVGTKGLRLKFSDAPFANGDTVTVTCSAIVYSHASSTSGPVASAQYVWSSRREGKSASATTTQVTGTAVGTKGVTIAFSDSGNLTRRDEFRILCSAPQPTTLGVTTLNYGSVTVSTYSPTKVVWFEILAGAVVMSNTKFGLYSHGTAQYHTSAPYDTKFAFGTAGEGNPSANGTEWLRNVQGNTHLSSDVPPSGLYATEDNLQEVSTADDSEEVGIVNGEMVSDFIYLAIKLGASEVGQNAQIIYRAFYDYS